MLPQGGAQQHPPLLVAGKFIGAGKEKTLDVTVLFLPHGQGVQLFRKQVPLFFVIYHEAVIEALADIKPLAQGFPQSGRNEETTLVVQRMPVFT